MSRLKLILPFILMGIAITIGTFAQSEAEKKSIRENIDWGFNPALGGTNRPTRLESYLFPVQIAGIWTVRGPISAVNCSYNGALFALAGYKWSAISWFQAAQSHNAHAMELYASYPDYTIEYALSMHKQEALKEGFLAVAFNNSPIPIQWIQSGSNDIKKFMAEHNPDRNPSYFRSSPTVERTSDNRTETQRKETQGDKVRF